MIDEMNQHNQLIVLLATISSVEGDEEFLARLRELLTDPQMKLMHIGSRLDDNVLGGLYFLSVLINDIWVNLAIDTGFEFPIKHANLLSLTRNLRRFILWLVAEDKESHIEDLYCIFHAVKDYFSFLGDMEDKLKRGMVLKEAKE